MVLLLKVTLYLLNPITYLRIFSGRSRYTPECRYGEGPWNYWDTLRVQNWLYEYDRQCHR